jgi:hypothetical protein
MNQREYEEMAPATTEAEWHRAWHYEHGQNVSCPWDCDPYAALEEMGECYCGDEMPTVFIGVCGKPNCFLANEAAKELTAAKRKYEGAVAWAAATRGEDVPF